MRFARSLSGGGPVGREARFLLTHLLISVRPVGGSLWGTVFSHSSKTATRLTTDAVTEWALRDPARQAVVSGGRRLTYAELDRLSAGLAGRLRARLVGPGECVGVSVERSVEAVVAILGVLRAGAAYVPLDPDYPTARRRQMALAAGIRYVVTSKRNPGLDAETIDVNEELPVGPDRCPPPTMGDVPRADAPAYVIFTSGSTGRPKGVVVSHANLAFSTSARLTYYRAPVGRYLLPSSLGFDSSVAGLFWTLETGGCLVIPTQETAADPAHLAALIENEGVSHLLTLPSLYRLILGHHGTRNLGSLEVVIVAGESCPPSLTREHFRRLPQVALYNEYGPTEATVWSTVHRIEDGSDRPRVPIGRAIPGATVHVFDEQARPVVAGQSGELYIGGPGVAVGYLNDAALTAERFPVHHIGTSAERLYRTGDRVAALPDGSLDFLGRIDQQIKIRGHRIETGEVEAALLAVPGVEEACAVALERESGDASLIAYVRASPGTSLTTPDLTTRLAENLPEAMVPTTVMWVTEWPRLPNGKIDRQRLPSPGRARPDLPEPYAPPRGATQAWLAALFAEVLGLDRVGIHDRFFDLGGDSIGAARITLGVQTRLGEPVFVVLLFTHPTVAQLATALVANYGPSVRREFGEGVTAQAASDMPVTEAALARAATLVRVPIGRGPKSQTARNRPAIFLLAPPRSGTTLLTAMLAGHRDVAAASELNLLAFDSLAVRCSAYRGPRSLWREGAIRALMDLEQRPLDDALAEMNRAEEADQTAQEFFARLQRAAAPRLLLDKSPAYALDLDVLTAIDEHFEDARFVHLCRDPRATVRSFISRRLEQVYFNHEGYSAAQAAEIVWTLSHRNILAFEGTIRNGRIARVRYETLVSDPERSMRTLLGALGLAFDPRVLRPYEDKETKVPRGLYPESTSMGDPRFHTFTAIMPNVEPPPDRERRWCGVTRDVARVLGYDLSAGPGNGRDASEAGARSRSELDSRRQRRTTARREPQA